MIRLRRAMSAVLLAGFGLPALAQSLQPKNPDTRTTPAPNVPEDVQFAPAPAATDYPDAEWVPANRGNYQVANRPADRPIDMVVVHDIEGSALSCLSWFQNPQARASSHYVVDSIEGKVYQMVQEKDIGWHAGSRDINARSVGIEHEGYAYRPGFFNPVEYETAARLIRDITRRHNIPRDRQHIIGHHEVPNPNDPTRFGGASGHTDPGPYWDWDALMTLIRNDARFVRHNIPNTIRPGELIEVSVSYANTGDDAWVANTTGRADAKVTEKGAVYLGTWNPAQRISPFFNYKFWTSPRVASSVENGDAQPGGEATFTFSLLGPRRIGTFVEDFRPVYVPVLPRGPVAFGDAFSVAINVVPWDIEVAATDASTPGPEWNAKGSLFWRKAGEGAPFAWTPALTIGGKYDVYARWTPEKGRSRAASYEIVTSDGVVTRTVDQRTGGGWVKLGRYPITDPKTAQVRLLPTAAPGILIADAVRFVGPFE